MSKHQYNNNPNLTEAKNHLRGLLLRKVRQLSLTQRSEFSVKAAAILAQSKMWTQAHVVAAYAPLFSEINLTPLFSQNDSPVILLPRVEGQELKFYRFKCSAGLRRGSKGVLEPAGTESLCPLEQADLVLIPGVGFTLAGKRLGRGGGYYDRALVSIPHQKRMGVCFPCQVIEDLPAGEHDQRVALLLDGTSIRQCGEDSPQESKS